MEFGIFQAFAYKPPAELLEAAKEKMVEQLCDEIRRLSKEYPEEFFITKDTSDFPFDNSVLTIGAKVIAPTISQKAIKQEGVKDYE